MICMSSGHLFSGHLCLSVSIRTDVRACVVVCARRCYFSTTLLYTKWLPRPVQRVVQRFCRSSRQEAPRAPREWRGYFRGKRSRSPSGPTSVENGQIFRCRRGLFQETNAPTTRMALLLGNYLCTNTTQKGLPSVTQHIRIHCICMDVHVQ